MPVTYSAFGEMRVQVEGTLTPVSRRRERGVLATLIAAHGAPVSAERLITEVWGDDAPEQTLGSLQVAVSRLRSLLAPDRTARSQGVIVSSPAGYALAAATDDVDVWTFEEAAQRALRADGAPAERARLGRQASELWLGLPYPGVDAPLVTQEAARLTDLHADVRIALAQALLDGGHSGEAQRLLAAVAPDHPYQERLWCLLALARYREGRQAEALEALRELQRRLADDLGVDAAVDTRSLEEAILRQDASLTMVPAATAEAPASLRPASWPDAVGRPRSDAAPSRRPSYGRDAALAAAVEVLDDAVQHSRSRHLVVGGEPGIGKSRYAEDVVVTAEARGFTVLTGRCYDGGFAPALWPWISMLRSLGRGTELDPRSHDALAPLLDPDADPVTAPGGVARMFDATLSAITEAARRRPLLLVLEDLHWADATSLHLLGHLVRAQPAAPVVVVATRRTTEVASPPLVDCLADLARAGATRLHLEGLGEEAVAAILRGTLGASHPALEAVVAQVTGGNPLFVEQYARVLSGRSGLDELDPASLEVPDGVRDVLRQRIARLPERARGTLSAASVFGLDVSPEQVASLSGSAVDTVLDDLDLALASGLVTEQTVGYAFVHALAREAVYLELSAARRMRLHDHAGRILEDSLGTVPDAATAIARHAHLAAPLGGSHAERAVAWQSRAAEVAAARHAHSEALDLWRTVLGDVPAESELAARAHGGIAVALMRLGDLAGATESLERGVQLAETRGAWDTVADLAGLLASAGPWSWRTHGAAHEDFIRILDEAIPHVSPERRARLHAVLQMEHSYAWRSDVGDAHGERSLVLARDLGDPDLLREVLLMRVVATTGSWEAETRLEWAREVLDLAPEGEQLVTALWFLGLVEWENRCPSRADDAIARCSAVAAELRHDGLDTPIAWWFAARARDRGDPAQHDLSDAAVARLGQGSIATDELTCVAAVRRAQGGPVPDKVVARARGGGPSLRALVAHALLEAGARTPAYELLGPAAPDGAVDYSSPAGRCLRLLVLAETGSPDEVREALAPVEPHLGRVASYGSIDHCGVVDHFVAAAYDALGDPRATETAERALELNRALGCEPWVRRSEELARRLG